MVPKIKFTLICQQIEGFVALGSVGYDLMSNLLHDVSVLLEFVAREPPPREAADAMNFQETPRR